MGNFFAIQEFQYQLIEQLGRLDAAYVTAIFNDG